jgi:cytochrome bd-type quinol oxidase subunit 2
MDCRIIKKSAMKTSRKIQLAVLVALSQVQFIAAQTPDFVDDVQDVPVDNWVIPMAIIGVALMYFFIKKKRQSLV